MDVQGWVVSVAVASAVCGGVMHFSVGPNFQKGIRLLCGLILCAVVLLPFGGAFENFSKNYESLLIIGDYGNRIESQEGLLGEELVLQNAEERLADLAWEELARRLEREDFRVAVCREGTAEIVYYEKDFPHQEAKLILSALLGGCQVETKGEKNAL